LRALPIDDDPLLGISEIHERYGVGRAGILAAEKRGEIQVTRKTGRQTIYVRRSALDAWDSSGARAQNDDGDAERERQLRAWAGGAL
jgi:hypothetical protein